MLRIVAGQDMRREHVEAVAELLAEVEHLDASEVRWVVTLLRQLSQRPDASRVARSWSRP